LGVDAIWTEIVAAIVGPNAFVGAAHAASPRQDARKNTPSKPRILLCEGNHTLFEKAF
jgi:hypothetical protein